jgi:hypothetical protein
MYLNCIDPETEEFVSQEALLEARAEESVVDVVKAMQVSVAEIEALTGLDFRPLRGLEAPSVGGFGLEAESARPLESLEDIVMP